MTILVGILCSDGVVIGADSSTTFASPDGRHTISRQSTKKVVKVSGNVIYAGTGEVGFGQRFGQVLHKTLVPDNIKNKTHIDITNEIARKSIEDFMSTHVKNLGFGALVGFVCKNKFYLSEFPAVTFQPEHKTSDIWYVSMGSGQNIADPFLGFLRRVIWKNKLPDLEDGIFAAVWSIYHTIKLNTGGIDEPISIGIIEPDGQGYKASILEDSEIEEHQNKVEALESQINDIWNSGDDTGAEEIPVPET